MDGGTDATAADAIARGGAGAPGVGVTVTRRVEWHDTDAAGHYHHSAVLRWVESAETELHERLGLADLMAHAPRVRYEVDYSGRLYYRDRVEVALAVTAVGETSARYAFEVRRAGDGALAARGAVVVVNVERPAGGKAPWPDRVRAALRGTAAPRG
jgi:acyl-CoA thioester hydrolase